MISQGLILLVNLLLGKVNKPSQILISLVIWMELLSG